MLGGILVILPRPAHRLCDSLPMKRKGTLKITCDCHLHTRLMASII